jgi:hypothetical protein
VVRETLPKNIAAGALLVFIFHNYWIQNSTATLRTPIKDFRCFPTRRLE